MVSGGSYCSAGDPPWAVADGENLPTALFSWLASTDVAEIQRGTECVEAK
jgi:hypothetical protein